MSKAKAKRNRKVTLAPMPVEWQETQAQTLGTQTEVVKDDNPSRRPRLRRYRRHVLEMMRDRKRGNLKINARQCMAGLELHEAFCATQTSPAAIQEIYVDSTPRPDDVAAAQCEKMLTYSKMSACIPSDMMPVVRHVCCEGKSVRDGFAKDGYQAQIAVAQLQVALDILATNLRYS